MKHIPYTPLNDLWLKAAVAGSLWAAVEILLGSLLHNLRLPFSGTMLAFAAVWLMIGFQQYWKDKGLILRAGLIAALMKSISPSAVILGPMLGIFSEALILELAIRLLGQNPLGYLLGGALAVGSTLLHKIINLLILYGFDLVQVASALYSFALSQLGITQVSVAPALVLLLGLYLLAGALAASLGMRAGRKAGNMSSDLNHLSGNHEPLSLTRGHLFEHSRPASFSAGLMLLHLAALSGGLFLFSHTGLIYSLMVFCIYLFFCINRYPGAMKRLLRASFWIPFLVITLSAAWLLGDWNQGPGFHIEGLYTGLRMNLRAMMLITAFSAISTEIKNPAIKIILYRRGLAPLYQSLNLAFAALPAIIGKQRLKSKGLRLTMRALFRQADFLLQAFQAAERNRLPVIIITGAIGQGKTTYAKKLCQKLKKRQLPLDGFFAEGLDNECGQRMGFRLISLNQEPICRLMHDVARPGFLSLGRYYADPVCFDKGNEFLLSVMNKTEPHLVLIDELGPLELGGRGWSKTVEALLSSGRHIMVWIVRRPLLEKIVRRYQSAGAYVFDLDCDKDISLASEQISRIYHRYLGQTAVGDSPE